MLRHIGVIGGRVMMRDAVATLPFRALALRQLRVVGGRHSLVAVRGQLVVTGGNVRDRQLQNRNLWMTKNKTELSEKTTTSRTFSAITKRK